MGRLTVLAILLLSEDLHSQTRLRYVTTARQKAPVGHRDPIGVMSPDGRWIAFVAPGPSGYQQVFRVPAKGGTPQQITFDPSNKTHPAYAPDGLRLAFTVFQYEAQFWLLEPGP